MKWGFPYTCSQIFLFLGVVFATLFSFFKGSYLISLNVLEINSLNFDLCLFIDWVSLLFFSILCIMVSCVLKFSCVYMESDMFKIRFTWLVLSFVLSMSCLMFFPHFLFLLVGWDGLGMTSFLLVMYYLSDSSWAAGLKTYLMKRMGDSFFMLSLALFLYNGSWDMKSLSKNDILVLMVVLGCFTKSAQFPFSSWLPAAMAAPTPVSSLVHSSTLVTAGMYVMMRFCYMFPDWLFLLVGVSGMWTLYSASLAACCEYDAKKMVAYSTLSQLGLMTVAISLKLPMLAFFHLLTHAMFKALMFICVGYLMKKSQHMQDLRSLNGMWYSSPFISITMMISNLSLLGFPFLAGFFSKELMIENNLLMMKVFFHFLLLFSLPLTSYYSGRLVFKILKGVNYKVMTSSKDDKVFFFSLFPLFVGSMFLGVVLYPKFYSLSSIYPCHMMKFFVFMFMFSGMLLSWYDVKINNMSFIWFCSSMSFLVPFKSSYWNNTFSNLGSDAYYLLDQGLLSKMMFYSDHNLSSSGSWINSSVNYFSSPKAKYYMSSMFAFSMFVGFIS